MTETQIREAVLQCIKEVAPEADINHINPALRFRDQFSFDSVDFLNFTGKLRQMMNIVNPESEFPRLITLIACTEYLGSKLNG